VIDLEFTLEIDTSFVVILHMIRIVPRFLHIVVSRHYEFCVTLLELDKGRQDLVGYTLETIPEFRKGISPRVYQDEFIQRVVFEPRFGVFANELQDIVWEFHGVIDHGMNLFGSILRFHFSCLITGV
jgi:hypothetical protein